MFCHQYLFTLFLHQTFFFANGNLLDNLERKVDEIKQRDLALYGNDTNVKYKLWELEMDDRLRYPRRNKNKLSRLASLWTEYYTCTLQEARSLVHGRRRANALAVLEGAIARLPCGMCVAPGESLEWEYADSLSNQTFTPIPDPDRTVQVSGTLVLQGALSHSGVYRCRAGETYGPLVLLEVLEHEDYNVVKTPNTRGPYAAPPLTIAGGLTVFSSWSAWSECHRCGRVGRRRRFGICTVGLSDRSKTNDQKIREPNHTEVFVEVFQVFAGGIPCRSQYLTQEIRNHSNVTERKSEIMIALCKVKCKPSATFEVHSADGRVLERVDNGAGEYSLKQTLPRPPLAPVNNILFIEPGERVALKCPGIILVDVPVTWRVGTRVANARALRESSEGRVHINARDHFIITRVEDSDDNLYSCWCLDALVGTVKLVVRRDARVHFTQHLLLLACVFCSALAARCAYRLYSKRRPNV